MMAIWLMSGQFTRHHIYPIGRSYICRATLPSIKRTILIDFIDVLHSMNAFFAVDYNRTNLVFSFEQRSISFVPLDDEEKVKGISPLITVINEADSTSFGAFTQLNLRTRKHLFLDYNPSNPDSYPKRLEDTWLPTEGDDMSLDISTYHDNPFLEDTVVNEIKRLERVDYELFQVYNRGQWAQVTGLIYPHFQVVDRMPDLYDADYWGLDFGFEDSTALVHVRKQGMALYIDELIYKEKMLVNELAFEVNRHKIPKVYADSAAPNTIEELRRRGVKVKPAKKGRDSVINGINKVRQHELYIVAGSTNIINELKRYKWEVDAEGNRKKPLKPIDTYNHACDSIRYALSFIMNRGLKF